MQVYGLKKENVYQKIKRGSCTVGQIYNYPAMTMEELKGLDPLKTIFLMALSPLEAHGPHLPVGTDVILAEKMLERYMEYLQKVHPQYNLVVMPSLTLGADALPRIGSVEIPATLLEKTLYFYGRSLAAGGFKYLFIADNHGGPRHLLAIEAASRKAYKKHGFYIVNPFVQEFFLMMQADGDFLADTGLASGTCGDLKDLHAGTNETSLMLAEAAENVRENYRRLEPKEPPQSGRIFKIFASLVGLFGNKVLAAELRDLGSIANWAADEDAGAYIGSPALATAAAGEQMIAGRMEVAGRLFAKALKGEPISLRPPLWPLRVLRYLP